MNLFTKSKEEDLRVRLQTVARLIARDLQTSRPAPILWLIRDSTEDEEISRLETFAETRFYDQLASRLDELARLTALEQAAILTPHSIVIAESTRRMLPGSKYPYEIDQEYIDAAAAGGSRATPLYWIDGFPYKRYYTPLRVNGKITSVLELAVSPAYVGELRDLNERVLIRAFVSSCLLVIVGILIYRLFSYLVRVEKQAMQGARIEAMGALAAGVAHELRNPLSIIRALSEEIQSQEKPGSLADENTHDIIREIERLNELITQFLSLSRAPSEGEAGPLDLREEMSRVVQLMQKGADGNVRISADLPDAAMFVQADQRALRQMLLNLMINAREALGTDGGEVKLTLRERRGNAEIHVIDNGHGIPARDLERVLEPFYTTKPMGTGLGLPITRSIVENLGGSFEIASTPGKGTDISMILPLHRAPGGATPRDGEA